jgi:DNA-binding GntR family transcriptional regulator
MRQPVSFRTKKDLVSSSLRTAILRGDLKPGTRLVIDDMAAKLGTSQIPVREALQQLHADGFVVIEPYVGARVSEIQSNLIDEIFDLLEAMEVISGRMACQNLDESDLAEIEGVLRKMDSCSDDLDRWCDCNVQLHQLICERAGTPLVRSLLGKVLDHWDRVRRCNLSLENGDWIPAAQREHWSLLEALRSKNADQVEKLTHTHNRSARKICLGQLSAAAN